MHVLAIDTSNQPLTVAVLDDERVLATTTMTTHRKHAEYLMPIVEKLVKYAKLTPQDLDRVVISNGPGSYTGIRIATTVGKVLADTLNIDLVGISSLMALVLNVQKEHQLVVPLFDGRNDNLFTGLYRTSQSGPEVVIEDQHINFDKWLQKLDEFNEPIIFVGSDVDHFVDRLKSHFGTNFKSLTGIDNLPQAAKIGVYGEKQDPVSNINNFNPNYLRLTKAQADWQKLNPGRENESYVEKN